MALEEIRQLARAGKLRDAQRAIARIEQRKLSRPERLEFAYLCFEAGQPLMTVSVLRPVVRPRPGSGIKPRPEEIAEYARSLSLLGLTGEARELLSKIDFKRHVLAVDSIVSVMLRDWEWQAAVPLLKETLRAPAEVLGENHSLLLQLDLGIALAFGQEEYARSRQVLEDVVRRVREGSFPWIRYNALMNLAMISLLSKDWKDSDQYMDQAERVFAHQPNPRFLHLNLMRRSFLELARSTHEGRRPGVRKARAGLAKARAYFLESGLFWFCRACDYNEGIFGRDPKPLLRLYFGSAHAAPKRRALLALERMGEALPRQYEMILSSGSRSLATVLDLAEYPPWSSRAGRALRFKPGQLCHRLFTYFVSELYKRPGVSELFGVIYPEQHFDPGSSPLRIANGLVRLRAMLSQARFPAIIRVSERRYWLEPSRPLRVRLAEKGPWSWEPMVRERFGDHPFLTREFAELAEITERMARYRLKEACERGWVSRSGTGRATRFRLAKVAGISRIR